MGIAPFARILGRRRARARVKDTLRRPRPVRRVVLLLALPLVLALALAPGAAATGPPNSYTTPVFSDGFESGTLLGWNGLLGNGSATVTSAAARTGAFGLRMSNGSGQFQALAKGLPAPMADSSTTFWVRFASGGGFQMVAQARDAASSAHMWDLAYEGGQHTFYFYPYTATGATEIATGAGTAPADTWIKVEIQYTATATGGARLYVNDQTQASWSVAGDYTRSANLARLQLWNDGPLTTDFDDVYVGAPAAPASVPDAPTNVTGVAANGSVNLSWTAPASDGGSQITSYRITPYIGANAQTPIITGTPATSRNITGLANGTTYTFRVAAINSVGTGPDSAPSPPVTPPGYSSIVFTDGFESGSLSAWDGLLGNGSATVIAGAAHAGSFGLRLSNAAQQFQVLHKGLAQPLIDSSTTFWVRFAAGTGFQSVAQARDVSSAAHMWDLYYDGGSHQLFFYPYTGSGSTEIATGANSVPTNVWVQVELQYTASSTGGARLLLNGQTQAGWSVSGNYTRTTNLQRIQLWNDGNMTADFDQVTVAAPPGTATLPGAPTNVNGTAGNGSVALTWTAPASDGGSPITGYRITPYIGTAAQTPILTGSAGTSFNVTGLTNGTTYTFTVAAINAVGAGPDSAASPPVTPVATPTPPGAPSNVLGVAGDRSVALSWTAPTSDGGRPITSYRITPYIGSNAQTPVNTGSASTSFTVTGLTNGTTYTFTVAATNSIGTGAASAASAAFTPQVGYTEMVFANGFESGDLTGFDGAPGNGTTTVTTGAARQGTYGLRMVNAAGQYSFLVKALASPLVDSSSSFWVKLGSGSGMEMVAQARDGASAANMWQLYYDWARGGYVFYPFTNTGSVEIFTGIGSGAVGSWQKVEIQYNASATGGARIYLNGQTQPAWGVGGNYTRTTNLQRVQLWNDAVGTTEYDDVRISAKPPGNAQLPGAPTGVAGNPRDHAVDLTWTAPTSNGGSVISGYRITPYIGSNAQTPTITDYPVTSATVGGLNNGTAYTFRVAAINGVGIGPDSSASGTITPAQATVPAAPTNVVGSAGDTRITLGWTAPSSDGGSPITGYRITPFVGGNAQTPITVGAIPTNYVVTGLTNGTAYTFTVAAINTIGLGPPSTPSQPVTPVPALSQYTNLVFTDGFESGNLSNWTGATQGTGTVSVTSLAARGGGYGARIATLETQYAYFVKALDAPVTDSVSTFWFRTGGGSRVATVAQARDGGSSVIMWELSYDGSRHGFYFYPFRNAGSTEIFTGVDTAPQGTWLKIQVEYKADAVGGGAQLYINGQTQPTWGVSGDYTRPANLQRLQLWNEGLTNNDFDDVSIATLPPPGAQPPGAPTGVNGSPLDRAVSLTWNAPASDGGSPITGYRITPYVGATAQDPVMTGSAATTFVVAGLVDGVGYTFRVAAINAAGIGADSTPSPLITPQPAPPPGPPTDVTAAAGNGTASIRWSAPVSDGGSPLIGYRITPYIGSVAQTPINTGNTLTSYTVTGLSNGTTYTFTVLAINGSGPGPESVPSNPVTPAPPTVPGAPTGVTGAPRDSAVALTWTAPASDGGSPITSYRITPYIGANAQTPVNTGSTATGFTVGGLHNGTTYTFTVAATNAVGTGAASAQSPPVTPAVPPANPIVLENRNQGTTSWQLTIDHKALNQEIEGYASKTSVNKGSTIDFMVSTSNNTNYTMDIYRMGWYPQGTNPDGSSCAPSCGGRLMQHVGPLSGSRQAACPTVTTQNDPDFGMTECHWTTSYTLTVPASWTTGNYVVKLKRTDGQQWENYMTFVVRDDSSTAPVVYDLDVSTWQAYNYWGGTGNNSVGYSLYARYNDLTGDNNGPRAYTVSFDRPYFDGQAGDGAGHFFDWDYPMIRWMESQGYDMTYVTSIDLESNPSVFTGHRVMVNTGHDEYYSDNMRDRVRNAISSGVNMALFSANNFYYRIIWSPSFSGVANRRMHADKNALPNSTTFEWRLLPPPLTHPENEIGGVMLGGVANDRPFLVSNASSWIYAGTGLHTYSGNGTNNIFTSGGNQNALPGVVGYEFDSRASTTPALSAYVQWEPAGLQTVGHSYVPAADGNATNTWSDATLYTAPNGGGTVFSAGTIQWPWGLDAGYGSGFCGCAPGGQYVNAATQRITSNIINHFIGQ
ncbi:MAG TPA: fibronectin type III domain-containing protein [Gaiellaceae bacterium]